MLSENNLVWIDCEMTGLIPEEDTILEIATIVTDSQLNVLAEGPVLAIHQPEEILTNMDEWNTTHHTESGLLDRVRQSTVTLAEAEAQTLAFLKEHTFPRTAPLCGNSIAQDKMFLRLYMPAIIEHLHYRMIDVSSIKELVRRWFPEPMHAPAKRNAHLALDDIRESIEELQYYRTNIFRELG